MEGDIFISLIAKSDLLIFAFKTCKLKACRDTRYKTKDKAAVFSSNVIINFARK